MPRIFISYSQSDQPIARELAGELEGLGGSVWFDAEALRPGDDLSEKIGAAIRSSDLFLLLVSQASSRSDWVRQELEIALAAPNGTRVVPVLLADAELPSDLSGVLSVKADTHDLGAVADRVLGSVSRPPRRVETFAVEQVAQVLSKFDVVWKREPSIAGVRPDFVVDTPDGKRLIVEAKTRSNPSLLEAVQARSQAARLRDITGADDAVTVFPRIGAALPAAGIVGLADLEDYLREFAVSQAPARTGASRPRLIEQVEPKTVFASMPFAPQYEDTYWVAMTYAAQAVGATCIRVDREDFDGDIPAEIKNDIESSIAVIADLSGSNADVLYEVGYAQRHGCPCVQICSTPIEELPFNVRNVNTLKYSQGQTHDLRQPLGKRLAAALEGR